MKSIIAICILLLCVGNIMATELTFVYPANINTSLPEQVTTKMYIGHCGIEQYDLYEQNYIADNCSCIIIKDIHTTTNILESPHTMVAPMFTLIPIIFLFAFMVLLMIGVKNLYGRAS